MSDVSLFLEPGATVDSRESSIVAFAHAAAGEPGTAVERAVRLYYAVRDGVRYDPYNLELSIDGMKASTTLRAGRGYCVAKAVLLAAVCRAAGIPARLGFADVRNHLSTARMRAAMKTDVFYWHGYTSIHLDGRWVKATPAFNVELCDKFGLRPLEFDGREDSIYHPFDNEGRRHMEYLAERGEYADVPLAEMVETFREKYSEMMSAWTAGDFRAEVDEETRR